MTNEPSKRTDRERRLRAALLSSSGMTLPILAGTVSPARKRRQIVILPDGRRVDAVTGKPYGWWSE